MKKIYLTVLAILALSFIVGIYFYSLLPDQIASHWDTQGQVNGYMGKFWGIFLLPIIMAGMSVLFYIIPKIDPLRKNFNAFKKAYGLFWIFILLFLGYMHALMLAWNIGPKFNFVVYTAPAIAALFYCLGITMGEAKQNWFFGIRTPWTLSNEIVWNKTHKLGSALFKIAAIFPLLSIIFQDNPFVLFLTTIIPALSIALATFIYSYVEYKKLK